LGESGMVYIWLTGNGNLIPISSLLIHSEEELCVCDDKH